MDIKECHRVLELEIGASRDAVEAAYLRLLERWHPDRVTPAGDPAATEEAARMVQAVNEAYQALIKIAPANAALATEPVSARKKPTLSPLTSNFTPGEKPPPPPKPTSVPPPPPPPPPRLAAPPPFAPPQPLSDKPVPPAPSPRAPAPIAPSPSPAAPSPATAVAQPTAKRPPPSSLWSEAKGMHDAVFPAGTARRRFSPLIIAAALFLLFLLAKWALPASHHKSARDIPPDPTKTGNIVVKSNRPDTEVELSGGPTVQQAASATFHGSGADVTLRGLLPGKYILTAKSGGWPDIQQDVNVDVGRASPVAVHFKSGSLRVDSDPAGATVRLASSMLGKTPLVVPQLPPGECQLSVEYPTWPAVSIKTTIKENEESTAKVRLPHGRVSIGSVPSGATVLVGKLVFGKTPLTLESVPAGTNKFILKAKNFPPLEVNVTVNDGDDAKISGQLGLGFPELDPPSLLRAVWIPDDPNQLAPGVDSLGVYEPRNGIVKNINRKRLYENWLKRSYRYAAAIKSYDRENGKVEFVEQTDALSKYRIVAELSPAIRADPELVAQLIKGAPLTLYGRLDAVEEPRWPFKVITLELSAAEVLH
jgi:hypothetical protein